MILESADGDTRVESKVLDNRPVLHVRRRAGQATGRPYWTHVAYCSTPGEVGRHVDLATLREVVRPSRKNG